jgi:ribosomal protein S18 acetylase RimI-like enzyme
MAAIRKYEERDFVDYVVALEKTTGWRRKAGSELKTRLERMKRGEQIWVAEISGRAVGFVILAPNRDGSLELDWLDVHPDFQRMGIGTLLVKKAEKVAKAKRRLALSIHTWKSNKQMVGFALKNDFQLFEVVKDFYGKRKNALYFRKPMTP